MKPITLYSRFAFAVLTAWLIAAAQGCSLVREDVEYDDVVEQGSTFYMSISIITSMSSSTRADSNNAGFNHSDDMQENGSDAENYIDFANNDFQLILFDSEGNYLLSMDAMDRWSVFPYPSGSGSNNGSEFAVYKMERKIEFPESVSETMIESIKQNGFQVLVLANWNNAKGGGTGTYKNFSDHKQTLSEIWKEKELYNFKYDYAGWKPTDSDQYTGYVTWIPEHQGSVKKLIPMFGYVEGQAFILKNGEYRSESKIHMQRAVAKIEVLDNLVNQPKLEVTNVTMTNFNTSGRFIPDVEANPNWNKVGSQVDKSSLPNDVVPLANLRFHHIESEDAADGKGKFVAYVPEMELDQPALDSKNKSFNPKDAADRPHLKVEITNRDDPNSEFYKQYSGGIYDAHFAKYDADFNPTIPDDSWNHILRNHIYRFSVNKVGLTVDLHLHVTPWDKEKDEEWDFTDHVTISKALTWDKDTYDFLIIDGTKYGSDAENGDNQGGDDDNGYNGSPDQDNEVYLKLDRTILVGRFKIATPQNGRWYARLTPVSGANPNAVSFVYENGDPLPGDGMNISGMIDGTVQSLYIRQSTKNNEDESRFKLEFWVENLGVWMSVPMPDGPYTIVRQGNLIQ